MIRKVVNGRGCVATKEWTCPADVLTAKVPEFGCYIDFELADLVSRGTFCIDQINNETPNKPAHDDA